MYLNSIFGCVCIGRDKSGWVKPSFKGLAVRVSDCSYVAKDGNNLVEVDGAVIDGSDRYVIRLPKTLDKVQVGDLIITSDKPFRALFVKELRKNGTFKCLDPQTSLEVDYLPPTNLFLGNKFVVTAINLLEGFTGAGADANNLLPFLALGGGLGDLSCGEGDKVGKDYEGEDDLTTLLLLLSLGGQATDFNKLLPFLLLKGSKGDCLETLLLLQVLGVNLGNPGGGQPGGQPGRQAQKP